MTANIRPGDIIHAATRQGADLICLVTCVSDGLIEARTITSQMSVTFDRPTGTGAWGTTTCRIDCVQPLPPDIRKILLGLDSKYQNDAGGERLPEADFKLSDAEKRALLFTGPFYAERKR